MIDPGTLSRNVSNPPGVVGSLLAESLTSLRDAISWQIDRSSLYATLTKEGLGFLVDVYGGKEGGGALPIAEAWDQRIKNMAVAHNTFSSEHRLGAMEPFDSLARWFANGDEMKRKLLDHYIWGQGNDVTLTVEQMKLMQTYFDVYETNAYSPSMRDIIEESKKGKSMLVNTHVAGQNDALGNFSIYLNGVLKPVAGSAAGSTVNPYPNGLKPADPGVALVFDGHMNWTDYWDFDPKVAERLKERTGRPAFAEAAVNAVAALVDGTTFQVTSVTIPIIQFSGYFPVY